MAKRIQFETSKPKGIAVLGFAVPCPGYNQDLAYRVGTEIANRGFTTVVGNFRSTFKYALLGARVAMGDSVTIIDDSLVDTSWRPSDSDIMVSDENARHQMLINCSAGAIVIGGGPRTLSIAEKFLQENKPLCALKASGGVVTSELDQSIPRMVGAENAVTYIVSQIN